MSRTPRRRPQVSVDEAVFAVKKRKPIPHQFVLEAIANLSPETRPMFGCIAVYIGDKIVLILRDKPTYSADNGLWLATTAEHHAALRLEFPQMRSIQLLGKKITGWQVLPLDSPDFEEAALRACDLVLAGDPRIGKIPDSRRKRNAKNKTQGSPKPIKTRKSRASRSAR